MVFRSVVDGNILRVSWVHLQQNTSYWLCSECGIFEMENLCVCGGEQMGVNAGNVIRCGAHANCQVLTPRPPCCCYCCSCCFCSLRRRPLLTIYKWKLWPTRIEFIICWMHCHRPPYACFANVRMKYVVLNGVILFIFIIILGTFSLALSLSFSFVFRFIKACLCWFS